MSVFREHRFWSPIFGCDAVRLSMVDSRGSEFFKVVAAPEGKAYRQMREDVLDEIEAAVLRGDEPGEVCGEE